MLYLDSLWMIAGVAGNVEDKSIRAELGGQLARRVAGVVLVALQAVLHFVGSQLKGFSQVLDKLT